MPSKSLFFSHPFLILPRVILKEVRVNTKVEEVVPKNILESRRGGEYLLKEGFSWYKLFP